MALFDFMRKKPAPHRAKRSYAGASTSRLMNDFNASNRSPDSELKDALPKLRERSRDLARNNEYVKRYFELLKTNVVGERGFSLQVKATNSNAGLDQNGNDAVEKAFSTASLPFWSNPALLLVALTCNEKPRSPTTLVLSSSKYRLTYSLLRARSRLRSRNLGNASFNSESGERLLALKSFIKRDVEAPAYERFALCGAGFFRMKSNNAILESHLNSGSAFATVLHRNFIVVFNHFPTVMVSSINQLLK